MSRKTKTDKLAKKIRHSYKWTRSIRARINRYTLLSFGVCVASILIFVFLKMSASAKIAGQITRFGNVELQYNTQQIEGISPLCGCWAQKKAEDWRGISFVARRLQLKREGTDPVTSSF